MRLREENVLAGRLSSGLVSEISVQEMVSVGDNGDVVVDDEEDVVS